MTADAVSVTDGMLQVGERRIPLIAGELQFWRMPPDTWEPALRAARDAGVTLVSTYLSWRRHEPRPGEYDFDGHGDPRLDVRRFLRLCADAGVLVQLKPGPWICAEEPGGGYPDWLLERTGILARDDTGEIVIGYNPPFQHPVPSYTDRDYLAAVREWFAAVWAEIGEHVHPRGPVVALQLDNEPSSCFQDAMYSADYNDSSRAAFREWLEQRYEHQPDRLRSAWEDENVDFAQAEPPSRPGPNTNGSDGPPLPRARLHDWISYKTHATARYLETLRRMHVELGGAELLYTVNLVTHPVHDVPVAHDAIRRMTGAAVGEDHYYIPPLDTDDIHRLARSAATARAAGEPLPWVPELQAGIWRSPGEVVDYPEPTPLEQEIWWGAAIAQGFAGANLYMLADRENWEHSPFGMDGRRSAFFAPVERLVSLVARCPDALTLPPQPSVIIAWHRPDAYDAYTVAGTSRLPDVPWHDRSIARAYASWDGALRRLTALGVPFDLWDTATTLTAPPTIPLMVPHGSGVDAALLESIRATGRAVVDADDDTIAAIAAAGPHAHDAMGRVDRTLIATRPSSAGTIVHVVHWGPGRRRGFLSLPGVSAGSLHDLRGDAVIPVQDGRARLPLAPGHRVLLLTS